MNIAMGGYSEAVLLAQLYSSKRNVWYEYTIADIHDRTLGKVSVEGGRVSFDSTQEVMWTMSGLAKKSEFLDINVVDERIIPWMCLRLDNGDVVKWPLGRYLINPAEEDNGNSRMISITGYGMEKIAYDDKIASRFYVAPGNIYTSTVAQLLGSVYSHINLIPTLKTHTAELEWGIGTRKIEIVNALLGAISYNPIYFDEYGNAVVDEFIFPQNRSVEITYSADKKSILLDGFTKQSSKFEVANKYVRYVENADETYLISTYINDDRNSPYSTVCRGRTIVDSSSVSDIATQGDLDTCTMKAALLAMQSTETLRFNTLNMPGHGYQNCLFVSCDMYGINDKYIETAWEMELTAGGVMSHVCKRAVAV